MWFGWAAAVVICAGNLTPTGDAEAVQFGKKATGFLLSEAGLTFEVEGPTVIAFEFRGDKSLKKVEVHVDIERSGEQISNNTISLKKKRRGPKGYPLAAKLGISLPEGAHRLVVKADQPLAVLTSRAKKNPARFAAAPWTPLPAPVAETSGGETGGTEAAVAESEGSAQPPPEDPTVANDTAPLAELADAAAEAAPMPAKSGLGRAMRIAVYNLEVAGIEPNIGTVVTDSLLAEIRKLEGVSAIGMDEIQDMLSHEANKQVLGCEENDSCLAEIAGALGVDNLVTGKLSKAADSHVFLLRRIDQQHATVAGTVDRRLKAGSGQEFLMAVGPAVEELFPDRGIRAGVERGVAREVALRLDPPPLPTWSFWSAAGAAVAAGAAGGLFGLLAQNGQEDYSAMAALSAKQVVHGSQLDATGDAAESYASTANTLWITAGALAVATGVMALFTDWEGYGDEPQR